MIVTNTSRTIRYAALAACAFSIATIATPSRAEPTEASGASMYSGVASNPTTTDRSSRSRSHRASQAAFRNAQASAGAAAGASFGLGSSDVVSEARRYIGTNPTGRSTLWCAAFMNMVLERAGHKASGSNMARSFASYGRRVSGPQVGAIAVMSRGRRGGHVGVVSGIDPNGNPIVISGNHGRRVAESTYSRGRIYAYVMPN
jgi:uncharacterized protein (TIGR02594 family)